MYNNPINKQRVVITVYMKESLDITKVLKDAGKVLQTEWKTLLPLVFFAWLFSVVASFGVGAEGPFGVHIGPEFLYPLYNVFGFLAYALLSLVISIGLMVVFLKKAQGEKLDRCDMLDGFTFKKLFSFIGAYIIYSLLVLIGLVLLIIPGVFIAVALIPLFYVIIDKNVGPFTAVRETYELTKGHWWHVLGLTITTGIITFTVMFALLILIVLLTWLVSGAGSFAAGVLLALIVPATLFVILLTQAYIGLTHAVMYKELRDHKK